MSDIWVINASPVIVLAKAGLIRLVEEMTSELLLPQAVAREIMAGPINDPARRAVEAGWANRVEPTCVPSEIMECGLGAGETAVIAVARERSACSAVLDDAVARDCAKTFQVPLIGTLGIVLRAKKRGLISQAGEALRLIRAAGLHLDDRTIRSALERIGETW